MILNFVKGYIITLDTVCEVFHMLSLYRNGLNGII